MTEPVPADTIVTIKNTAAATSEDILTGEHTVSEDILRLNREWRPEEPAAQRFKDNVVTLLEGIINNTNTAVPDPEGEDPPGGGGFQELFYDSGYVFFEVGTAGWDTVEFKHNLGQVPTRFTLFYSNLAKPDPNNPDHDIVLIFPALRRNQHDDPVSDHSIGSRLLVKDKNTMELKIAPNGLDGFSKGSNDNRIPTLDGTTRPGYIRLMAWR